MKSSYLALFLVGSLSSSLLALPQQTVTKPVISATPVPAPAIDPPAPTAPEKVGPVDLPDGYVIGPDDSIQVTVWKEPGLSATLPVRPDGMISLPLLGDLTAAGLTPMKLSADISTRLKKFINDPNVNVAVLGVNSKRVFMIGEVQHIGAIPLTPGMSILQAIASAGGLTPYANSKHIYILRGEQGKQQKIAFDYKKAVKDGNLQGVSLTSGDTIVVP